MLRLSLMLVLAAPVSAMQDQARIEGLIRALDSDDFESREKAQEALVGLGEKAVPALRKALQGGSAELRARAEATLREIERRVKTRTAYREPRRITLEAKGKDLAEILREIGKQAGVRIDHTAIEATEVETVTVKDAPFFRALDLLCRGRKDRTYEFKESGKIEFKREPHVPYPTIYPGPLRIRLLKTELIRSNDFRARSSVLRLTLDADYERYLKPMAPPALKLLAATDDRGTELEVKKGFDAGGANGMFIRGGARIVIRGGLQAVMGGAAGPEIHEWTLSGLHDKARSVTVGGSVTLTFPLSARELSAKAAQSPEMVECDDYQIMVTRGRRTRPWTFTIKGPRNAGPTNYDDVRGRLVPDGILAIDGEGKKHPGTLDTLNVGFNAFNRQFGAANDPGVTLRVQFGALKAEDVAEVRFKFVDQTFEKVIPFEFEQVELP